MKRTTDQNAAHQLMLACRRLDAAIASRTAPRAESARGVVVARMADLLGEFGLLEAAQAARDQLEEFDGRHIPKEGLWECKGCGKQVEALTRHKGKLLCQTCIEKD